MWKTRLFALVIILCSVSVSYFVYQSEHQAKLGVQDSWMAKYPFKLGLDLKGGTHLVYRADVSGLPSGQVDESMNSLRDVIERRVNLFGVAEPIVQLEKSSFTNEGEERLIVDLPGVTNVSEAITMIGQTPLLEFRVEGIPMAKAKVDAQGVVSLDTSTLEPTFEKTELTGRYLDKAVLEFDPTSRAPIVGLQFDEQGSILFEKLTGDNIGKSIAIYLDGSPISIPSVSSAISGGRAQITGGFTPKEARELVGRLNSGALPVPIELISTQTIGATLGEEATQAGVFAGMVGVLLISLFLILWYRLPGFIAVLSLGVYTAIMLALFKLIPVTLTSAGVAGFIISLGLAVDANVLIFERLKEELQKGKDMKLSMHEGFKHAWLAIRDSNTSSIITAIILFSFGTALIKGFALVFGLGVIVSMFSAIFATRLFLYSLNVESKHTVVRFLFGSGFSNNK